jgi:hypothetical protein
MGRNDRAASQEPGAAPRLLPNGQPDQSNVLCSEAQSRQVAAAIARLGLDLAAFARR